MGAEKRGRGRSVQISGPPSSTGEVRNKRAHVRRERRTLVGVEVGYGGKEDPTEMRTSEPCVSEEGP